MTTPIQTGTYLDRILANTAAELVERKAATPFSDLEAQARRMPPALDMGRALRTGTVEVIAEVKRASPSKGEIAPGIVAVDVARDYLAGGAAAISVLTDEKFFRGSLDDLRAVAALAHTDPQPRPVLRKDFVIDAYQIVEARAAGADAVLLIVAGLADSQLAELHAAALDYGLSVLVEIHDEVELERALKIAPKLLGINNRDLRTFTVDLATTVRLAPQIPSEVAIVGESGIASHGDLERVGRSGAHAVLVGESLMRQTDRAGALRELRGSPGSSHSLTPSPNLGEGEPSREQIRSTKVAATPLLPDWDGAPSGSRPGGEGFRPLPLIKICGVREPEHALHALERGADFLGLVFFAPSPRGLTIEEAQRVSAAVRQADPERRVKLVGLFVNETAEHMNAIADEVELDIIQLSGDEQPEVIAALNRPAIKTVHANDANTIEATARFRDWTEAATPPWAVMLDTKVPGLYGGAGVVGDWELAAQLSRQARIFLAGGLTPENVGAAIQRVRPFAVDVSSGVETDRRKDPAKIDAFLTNAQAARASLLAGQRGPS